MRKMLIEQNMQKLSYKEAQDALERDLHVKIREYLHKQFVSTEDDDDYHYGNGYTHMDVDMIEDSKVSYQNLKKQKYGSIRNK